MDTDIYGFIVTVVVARGLHSGVFSAAADRFRSSRGWRALSSHAGAAVNSRSHIWFRGVSWSEREDLNLRPLVSQCHTLDRSFWLVSNDLACVADGFSEFSSGLLHCIQTSNQIVIDDMCIFSRGLDVGVVERLLHQLQVASFPQQLCREVVPKVMEPKVGYASHSPKTFPSRFQAAVRGSGIACP